MALDGSTMAIMDKYSNDTSIIPNAIAISEKIPGKYVNSTHSDILEL